MRFDFPIGGAPLSSDEQEWLEEPPRCMARIVNDDPLVNTLHECHRPEDHEDAHRCRVAHCGYLWPLALKVDA